MPVGESPDIFENFTYEEALDSWRNQVECSYSVPAAVISFNKSRSFMDAIKLSVCVGLDADTNACICGGIAGAYYGVPESAADIVKSKVKDMYGEEFDWLF